MSPPIHDPLPRPYMLHDIALEAQRLSTLLPPDNWDPAHYHSPGLERQPSGVFDLVSSVETGSDESEPLIAKPSPITRREAVSWKTCVCRWVRWCFGGRLNLDEG
ncbi:hypothetical protein HBI11_152740 [Parastagonospora nodorum]|nr:hypothetical protein HBI78_134250 [Parastagonospora nodorum]KAH5296514.1 hypothetical protein HBI50_226370 [Parastagonospora nodorum]KAH5299496.1 hypothetical protein HBI11_152740 [Parastagonospora nodorum]KAH5313672.1 hypothetical protein HBI12_135110 [Parastagonospora nodorum]KAH5341880.1 hypothetical protein HBI33_235230 [Parastagonospora nodorum]